MTRIILMLTLALAAVPLAPRPAAAECTTDYARCLSDSYYLKGVLQVMSDIECGAEYVNCVGSKLRFW